MQKISGYRETCFTQKSKIAGNQTQSFAQTLNKTLFGQCLLGGKYSKNGVITLEGMERELRELKDEFKIELNRQLSSAGLSRTETFKLEFAGNGRIQVLGAHPDKEAIEQMFIDDSKFHDLAARVCVMKDLIESSREAAALQTAYAADPIKAVAQYGHFFSGQSESYTMLCQKDLLWDIVFNKIT